MSSPHLERADDQHIASHVSGSENEPANERVGLEKICYFLNLIMVALQVPASKTTSNFFIDTVQHHQ